MDNTNLFHPGELYLQRQGGVEQHAANLGSRLILNYLTTQHCEFYLLLKMLFVASVDDTGQPWASVLVGEPGFIHAVDEKLMRINARPVNVIH